MPTGTVGEAFRRTRPSHFYTISDPMVSGLGLVEGKPSRAAQPERSITPPGMRSLRIADGAGPRGGPSGSDV